MKDCKNYKLDKLLNIFKIKKYKKFNGKIGYFKSKNINEIKNFAIKNKLNFNLLNKEEIILSKKEICLGKKETIFEKNKNKIFYHSEQELEKLKNIYKKISHLESIPEMIFENNFCLQEYCKGIVLLKSEPKPLHKEILINFLKDLNHLGFAHRDLHCKNIIISKKKLYVIDWDFVTEQRCDIMDHYDLTGKGLESPHETNNTHIFKDFPKIKIPSVAQILNISLKDFL